MADPREETEWHHIENTLMKVIKTTLIKGKGIHMQQVSIDGLVKNAYSLVISAAPAEDGNRDGLAEEGKRDGLAEEGKRDGLADMLRLAHHCQLQTLAVKLLPNDEKCLSLLALAFQEKVEFNDDLLQRIPLWKHGLCAQRGSPPDLLSLEEVVSNRMMAIHIRCNNHAAIIEFFTEISQRYLQAVIQLDCFREQEQAVLVSSDPAHVELYRLQLDYWEKRKLPLLKLIGYVVPKLPRYCSDPKTRKALLLELAKLLPAI